MSAAVLTRSVDVVELLDMDRALVHLSEHWHDLWVARLQGTPRPWTESQVSAQARAQMDARARIERHDRSVDSQGNPVAVGESPAPLHVEVLDLLITIGGLAAAMTAEVARAVQRPAPYPNPDPRPRLTYVRVNLPTAAAVVPLVDTYASQLIRLEEEVDRALRLVRDGQVLHAVCPWCKGMGKGALTLVIRELDQIGPVVMCNTPGCTPPSQDCGTHWRGRPCWRPSEWDWLAERLQPVEGRP